MINSRSRLKDSIELSHRHASKYIIYLPIQSSNLHATISALTPVQLDPPYAGNGLSQLLVLVSVPLPHVTEQEEFIQSPHWPSTKPIQKNLN